MLKDLETIQKSFFNSITYKWWTAVEDEGRLVLVARRKPNAVLRPVPVSWSLPEPHVCNWFGIWDPRYHNRAVPEYLSREKIPEWIVPSVINWYRSPYLISMPLYEFLSKTGPAGGWNDRLKSPIWNETESLNSTGAELK